MTRDVVAVVACVVLVIGFVAPVRALGILAWVPVSEGSPSPTSGQETLMATGSTYDSAERVVADLAAAGITCSSLQRLDSGQGSETFLCLHAGETISISLYELDMQSSINPAYSRFPAGWITNDPVEADLSAMFSLDPDSFAVRGTNWMITQKSVELAHRIAAGLGGEFMTAK